MQCTNMYDGCDVLVKVQGKEKKTWQRKTENGVSLNETLN